MELNDPRLAVISKALDEIQKAHGKGVIATENDSQVERFYIGSQGLAHITGGGMAKGRIMEMYGMESGGKTALACFFGGCCQAEDGIVAFVDAEHGLDPEYAGKFGLQTDISKGNFILVQPDNGEQALEVVEKLASTGAIDMIIVDSVAALVPKAEIEGDMGDSHMGLQARLMSQAMRKLTAIIAKTNTSLIFINQIRMKIGVMFGNPETTTGGFALKFYSSIRLDVRKVEMIMRGGEKDGTAIGIKTRVKCVKNKTAAPMKKVELNLYFDSGLDTFGEYIDWAVTDKIIDKAGSWYSYGGERIGQGAENVAAFLKNSPAMFEEIRNKVNAIHKFPQPKPIVHKVVEPPKERKVRAKAEPESIALTTETPIETKESKNEVSNV